MIKEIPVDLRLTKPGSSVVAVADVTLDLGDAGTVILSGFRVIQREGQSPWISLPARKSAKGVWFDSVTFAGPLKKLVTKAVLQEYAQVKKNGSKPTDSGEE